VPRKSTTARCVPVDGCPGTTVRAVANIRVGGNRLSPSYTLLGSSRSLALLPCPGDVESFPLSSSPHEAGLSIGLQKDPPIGVQKGPLSLRLVSVVHKGTRTPRSAHQESDAAPRGRFLWTHRCKLPGWRTVGEGFSVSSEAATRRRAHCLAI
jgi:hypothetical protein